MVRTRALSVALNYDLLPDDYLPSQNYSIIFTLNQVATMGPLQQQVVRGVLGARVRRPRNDDDPGKNARNFRVNVGCTLHSI